MKRLITAAAVLVLCLMAGATAQQQYPEDQFPAQLPVKKDAKPPHIDNTPPHSPESAGESSSKSTKIDLSPPKWEEERAPKPAETYSYNPRRAAKAIEVGTFYFKKGSYKAALSRFQEALQWKPGDADATFMLAQTFAKLGQQSEARANYEAYLKILPDGPHAKEARKALDKLPNPTVSKGP